jgi:hypothetical protein
MTERDQTAEELIYAAAVAVATLDRLTAAEVRDLPIERAGNHLVELRAVIDTLRQIEAEYERWIYDIFRDRGWPTGHDHPHTVEGVGAVRAGKRKTVKWDAEGAVKAWFEKWLDAWLGEHDGALPEPWDAIQEVLRIVGTIKQDGGYASVSLRKTPLLAAGVDTEEWSWDEYGAPAVKIEPEEGSDA